MTRIQRLAASLASLAMLGSLLGAPGVSAANQGLVGGQAVAPPAAIVGAPPIGTTSLSYYAGYSSYLFGGGFSRITGTWVVPKATCDGAVSTVMFAWVGLDDNGSKYLEQAGTGDYCIKGSTTAYYYSWYEMFPKPSIASSLVVRAGDTVRTTVSVTGSTFAFAIENLTTHKTFRKSISQTHAARLAAYWIVESPWNGTSAAHLWPLTKFAPITIKSASATAAGHTRAINSSGWNMTLRWTMKYGRTIKASTSGLNYAANAFTVTWHHR